jgi:hypothetical protein
MRFDNATRLYRKIRRSPTILLHDNRLANATLPAECLIQVGDKILRALEPNREPEQRLRRA